MTAAPLPAGEGRQAAHTAPGAEWLEPAGDGGFASGTAGLVRTRRYHALLLAATPRGRFVLVAGFEAWVDLPGGTVPITTQRYAPDVLHPDGASRIAEFTYAPWPRWRFALPDGSMLTQEVFAAAGQTNLRWTRSGAGPARLHVRLLLAARDYHAVQAANPGFDMAAHPRAACVVWRPFAALPPVAAWGGSYRHEPQWYYRFLYTQEQFRGLDHIEDLASPGVLEWDLATPATLALRPDEAPAAPVDALADAERARRAALPALPRAGAAYLATRGGAPTILAGFPWFTDWGRDTFIALRGLLLATGQREAAARILLAWAGHVDRGMLPNRFPDGGAAPEYNAVDASLWFVVAVHDLLAGGPVEGGDTLRAACADIVGGYAAGTRYGIRMDADGLITAGAPGTQLTWMDAKVGDWVVTPRRGKPVEVQALWINALRILAAWPGHEACCGAWAGMAERATASLLARFPDPATGGLLDLVNGDLAEARRVRPNQVLAVGGLPHQVVPPILARGIVDLVEARLLTPLGLRTLDPADPAYCPRYGGGVAERDGAYHQGTAWPWLLGPFVEAWLRVRGHAPAARAEARARFLPPLHAHLGQAGLGHVSEVVDGDAPHAPGGCPFQAWSLGELLRIEAML